MTPIPTTTFLSKGCRILRANKYISLTSRTIGTLSAAPTSTTNVAAIRNAPVSLLRGTTTQQKTLVQQRLYSSSSSSSVSVDSLYTVSVEADGIAVLKFHNAPVNALSFPLLQHLDKTLADLESKAAGDAQATGSESCIKGLIITSDLPKVFSAGLDIPELIDPNPQRLVDYITMFQQVCRRFAELSIPTVAAINGVAPAGGTVFSLLCDTRITFASNAQQKLPPFTMGLNETALGMTPPPFIYHLAQQNWHSVRQATTWLQRGTLTMVPEEAQKLGLVDRCIPIPQGSEGQLTQVLLSEAKKEIANLLKTPWLARASVKRLQNETMVNSMGSVKMVTDSIIGPEFQRTIRQVLASLKKKK